MRKEMATSPYQLVEWLSPPPHFNGATSSQPYAVGCRSGYVATEMATSGDAAVSR